MVLDSLAVVRPADRGVPGVPHHKEVLDREVPGRFDLQEGSSAYIRMWQ